MHSSYLSARTCLIDEFDENAWHELVESVMVRSDGTLVIQWKAGTETGVGDNIVSIRT